MITFTILLFLVTSALSDFSVHYDITIIPEASDLSFTGTTGITYRVEKLVETITLKAKNLEVSDVRVFSETDDFNNHFRTDEENESLVIDLEVPLISGFYNITVSYSGKINENLEGFYVSTYTRQNGDELEERSFFLADFRYYNARQVFPCEDDPTHIATYILSIVRPNDYVSLFNTPLEDSEPYDENSSTDIFTKTNPLPTHLLSFAIIDFPPRTYENITVYSPKLGIDFMGELSSEVVKKFQELEPFNLNPITQIIVPDNSLSNGVLESIGLIIYKESQVLYNEETENEEDRQEIAKVVARAIVSNWYKNSTSFQWWPHWWARDGTTSLYQYEVLEQLFPSWRLTERFVTEELSSALEYDVEGPGIDLLLTENDTPDTFSQFQSTKAFSLLKTLSHLPQENVINASESTTALSWSQHKGYPLISVRTNNTVFTFRQGSLRMRTIPIRLVYGTEENQQRQFDYVLDEISNQLEVTDFSSDSWYLANSDRLGYYRSDFGVTNWRALTSFLLNPENDISKISPLSRAVLIDDVFYFTQLGRWHSDFYFELVQYLKRETDYIPIYAFIKTANQMKSLLAGTTIQEKFMRFSVSLVEHLYELVGTSQPSESYVNTIARVKILTWLCKFGHSKCQDEMDRLFSLVAPVEPNLQEPVYCRAIAKGSSGLEVLDIYGFLEEQYNNYKKKRVLRSMGCTSQPVVLSYFGSAILFPTGNLKIKPEDKADAFLAIVDGSDEGVNVALGIAEESLNVLLDFSENDISRIFFALSKKLVTEDHRKTVDAIIASLNPDQKSRYEDLFRSVKDNVEANIMWRKLNVDAIGRWLDDNFIGGAPGGAAIKTSFGFISCLGLVAALSRF